MDAEIPLPPPRRVCSRSPEITTGNDASRPQSSSRLTDESSIPSSDPAVFSSDDFPYSSIDNYQPSAKANVKKRRYYGTWWGSMKTKRKKRADFQEKRNLDSGVWMGSDESSENLLSSESFNEEDSVPHAFSNEISTRSAKRVQDSAPDTGRRAVPGRPVFLAWNRLVEEPKEHRDARALVNDCLESGRERVDLSGRQLGCIPSGLLRPLLHLTKQPALDYPPVDDDDYSPLTPSLQLFLSGNSLTELTGELFELENLQVLSLRNNKLREIPSGIRRLTQLQEINVSVNRLEHLPYEMLLLMQTGSLRQIYVHPNPLLQLENASDIETWHYTNRDEDGTLRMKKYEGEAPAEAQSPIHIATSRVRRLDSQGKPFSGHYPSHRAPDAVTRVPSLRDLALLACSRYPYLDKFLQEEDLTGFPELVVQLLRRARDVRHQGDQICSVCGRNFIVPRTEWIEWWDCSIYETAVKQRESNEKLRPLPFIRRGCSWGCVPASD